MLVGYMRVSSDNERQSFDLQRDALLAAGVDERQIFADKSSGSRTDRSGLAKALEYLKGGDTLIVWKLDRLGRSLSHLLTTLTTLSSRGIEFRSLTEQYDTTTAQGRFMLHLFGALAEFERSLTKERIQAGLAAAKRRGRHGGRPTKLKVDQIEAMKLALDGGASMGQVARAFKVDRETVRRTLARIGWSPALGAAAVMESGTSPDGLSLSLCDAPPAAVPPPRSAPASRRRPRAASPPAR
jgi:DNA invertase Pin-like site-specific DNA recombinase